MRSFFRQINRDMYCKRGTILFFRIMYSRTWLTRSYDQFILSWSNALCLDRGGTDYLLQVIKAKYISYNNHPWQQTNEILVKSLGTRIDQNCVFCTCHYSMETPALSKFCIEIQLCIIYNPTVSDISNDQTNRSNKEKGGLIRCSSCNNWLMQVWTPGLNSTAVADFHWPHQHHDNVTVDVMRWIWRQGSHPISFLVFTANNRNQRMAPDGSSLHPRLPPSPCSPISSSPRFKDEGEWAGGTQGGEGPRTVGWD